MSGKNIAIGIDIGGGHIKSAAVGLGRKEFIERSMAQSPVNNQAAAVEILDVWSATIKQSIESPGQEDIDGIGIGMPGPFDYVRGIALFEKVFKYENLYGLNVAKVLNTAG